MTLGINMKNTKIISLLLSGAAIAYSGSALAEKEQLSVQEAAKKSANPVSDVWMLITQNDYTFLEKE
ncbi:hypothetical protein AB4424_25475, partial [Vibrio splendidus]